MGSFLRRPAPGAKCLAAAAGVEQFQEEGQGLAKKSARNREISQGFHVDNRNEFGNTIGIHRDIHGILLALTYVLYILCIYICIYLGYLGFRHPQMVDTPNGRLHGDHDDAGKPISAMLSHIAGHMISHEISPSSMIDW